MDPLMMRMAAARFLAIAHYREARIAAERALVMGGAGWAGEFDTRVLLLQAHEGLGEAVDVHNQARQMVALAPENLDACWALIQCQLRAGDGPGRGPRLRAAEPLSCREMQRMRSHGLDWSPNTTERPRPSDACWRHWADGVMTRRLPDRFSWRS